MVRRLAGIQGLIAFLFAWGSVALCFGETTSIEEILRIHRENQERLNPLHLEVTYTKEATEILREYHRKQLEAAKAALELIKSVDPKMLTVELPAGQAPVSPEQLKEMILAELESDVEMHSGDGLVPVKQRIELFLRGEDYQVRSFLPDVNATAIDIPFPKVPLTPESLNDEYGGMRIYSRSSKLSPPARIWGGTRIASQGQAMVTAKHVNMIDIPALPPCLGSLLGEASRPHRMDVFFSQSAERWRIVGEERQDDRTLTVVEVSVPRKSIESYSDAEGKPYQASVVEFYRAWIDLKQGALPVQIHVWPGNERLTIEDVSAFAPSIILITKEIRKLANGGLYPAVTVAQHFGVDPSIPPLSPEGWGEVKSGKRKDPKVVHERQMWVCSDRRSRPTQRR